ncbi:archaeal holliday junction resolvase family protein [Orientia chuto str. Dubai]|uniref:Archaeal holliday junction resolvase family protein n=1 Tax=Orientia chuto str. Dubai TaxID=1359168 RepID=A0A0F3MNU5_9RICK|nr:YraN family protein [Candidatus Orientia mediorientalis]KJV57112.1 archaeal holliday junction resolvase family protein [Orientia chuto str. Dubai]
MISCYNLGILAEWLIIARYCIRLYCLIAHRMRNSAGEIDIICTKGQIIIFIEVKARRSNFDDTICSHNQIARIRKAAELYLYHNKQYSNFNVRFDLAIVRPMQFPLIIENAW